MSLLTALSGVFAGLLARDSLSTSPPPSPPQPAPPTMDARTLYDALLGMNGGAPQDSAPFQLYTTRPADPEAMRRIFAPAKPPKGVVPDHVAMALDTLNNPLDQYGYGFGGFGITEGMHWLGYPYLAELAQRTEYRRISETIAKDMTRRWFRLQATGRDDKTAKIKALEECIKYHKLQEKFTLLALLDGFFGRAHLYLDTGHTDEIDLLKLPLPVDPRMISKGSLKGVRVIEPMWAYPHMFNANDPLRENFYLPQTWWVMGKEIHRTRLLPFIGREMPDMLKPAYSFSGLSLSQMAKPYIDNWLRTRQSVSDLIHSFSTPVLQTNMGSIMNAGASAHLKMRAALFNYLRDNNNLMILDKTTEDFKNVSAPLGGLDHLQAQAQEHIASAVGIPLVVLTGISPSGLNATSEGELQVWAQFIHANQGSFFDAHLTTILNVMQLHLFGEIDASIAHAWEPLRELSEEEETAAEKTQADIDAVYINAGVLSPDEIRQRLSGEADSPYQGLDLSTPAPPPPQQEPDPLGGGVGGGPGGPPGGPGGPSGAGGPPAAANANSAPAGGSARPISSGPGHIGEAGSAKPINPKAGTRDEDPGSIPELDETGMPVEKGRGHSVIRTQDPNAEVHIHMGPSDKAHIKMGMDGSIGVTMGDAYNPSEPRDKTGEWTAGGQSYVQAGEAGEEGGRKVSRGTTLHVHPGERLAGQSSGEGVGMKAAAHVAGAKALAIAKGFGEEDRHVIHKHFASLTPEQRQGAANKIRNAAKLLPKLFATHWHEEKANAVNAAGAARTLLAGGKPTPEQWKAVRSVGLKLAMVGGMTMLGGGEHAEAAQHAAHAMEFGSEWLNHAMTEHALKLMAGVGRLGAGAIGAGAMAAVRHRAQPATAGDAEPEISPEDMQLLQRFALAMAKSVETLDEKGALQLIEQRQQAMAQDAWNESEHPRGGNPENRGQFSTSSGGGGETEAPAAEPLKHVEAPARTRAIHAAAFYSPSVAEHLDFREATAGLHSERQHLLTTASREIDEKLGLHTTSRAAIGAWSDGAENSIMTEMDGGSWEELKAAVAMKGWLAHQKDALVFQEAEGGNAQLYSFNATGSVEKIHHDLLEDGVEFHTIVPTEGGATVYACHVDGMGDGEPLARAVAKAAERYGTGPTVQHGRGEFLVGDTKGTTSAEQRHQARLAYKRIIEKSGLPGAETVWKGIRPTYGQAFEVTEYPKEETTEPLPGSQGHPALISTARPTSVGAVEGDEYRQANMEGMEKDPKIYHANMELLKNPLAYPNLRPEETEGKSDDELKRAAIDLAKANLRFLYERAPQDVREGGPLWYEGAHNFAVRKAEQYGLPLQSVVGVYAALSPQKLWDINVRMGDKLLEIYHTQQDHRWDDEMTATAERIWKPKDAALLARIQGKTLGELQLPAEKAMWIRTYDETKDPEQYFDRLSPDGKVLGPWYNLDGKRARQTWQNTSAISNAITALESGGNRDIISVSMGDMHKVRSFYNNILDPHSANDDVTMDTHAVGAALLRPETANSTTVAQSLHTAPEKSKREPGFEGASGSSIYGMQGTYPLWADAYRELASELGIEPRVLQSVTWVAKRKLFDSRMTKETVKAVQQTWRDYHAGKRSLADTQEEVFRLAGGMDKPDDGLPDTTPPKPKKKG